MSYVYGLVRLYGNLSSSMTYKNQFVFKKKKWCVCENELMWTFLIKTSNFVGNSRFMP